MKTARYSVLMFLMFAISGYSQQADVKIDSLKKVAKKSNAREKFKAFTVLSDLYSNNDLDKAMYYANQSLLIAKTKNDTFLALAYNSVANIYQYKSQPDSSLAYYKKSLASRQKIKDSTGIADSYNNIGIAYDQQAQFPEALQYYFRALSYYDKMADLEKQAMVFSNIGIVYKAQKEYPKALIYYRKAYHSYQKTADELNKTVSAGNLGSILINFKKYQESLRYSEIAKKGYQKLGGERYAAYPISSMAAVYDSLHDFDLANKNYSEAIRLHEIYKNGFEVAENANAYANCLIKQQKYPESIQMSEKALVFAKAADANLLVVQAYKNLSKAHAKLGDYLKAYDYANRYNIGKDSIFVNEKTKAVFEMETKYETAKKEKLLVEKEAEAQQKNILLIAISTLAFFIILVALLIYRQQKLKNVQQHQEHELKTAIAQIETQNKLQEQRLAISRDLHDNIGAQLTFIISSVDNIKYAFDITNAKLDGKLQSISNFTKSTILELRDTIWAMNNNQITFEDLRSRIFNFIEKAKEAKENIEFKFVIDENLNQMRLSSVSGMNVYRTIQEAVNNAIKYAEATVISIEGTRIGNAIRITISDNGKGFEKSAIETGNGLLNMEKRIEDIGGIFNLATSENAGTTITLLLNINENTIS